MAKKKVATAKPAEAAKGPGIGKKFCANCKAAIAARSTTCPECGVAIKKKRKKRGKNRAVAPQAATVAAAGHESNGHSSAAAFVKEAGGLDQAIRILEIAKSLR